jgi:hypothetical protein
MPTTIPRYEGAWRRQAEQFYPDTDRFTVHTRPDPAHGDMREAPPPLMMDATVQQGGGEIYTDSLWENLDFLPPATLVEDEPVQGQGTPEESGHGYGGLFRPGASPGELGAVRGRDRGSAKRQTSDAPKYRFFNEVFFGFFTKGFEPPPITINPGNPVFTRGRNSHAANNEPQSRPTAWSVVGDGWRRGDYEGSNVQRDFTPPNRRHGQVRMVEPDIVTIIGDAPPPDKPDVYASPFSSLQKFLPKRRRVSGMRRDPGPWDDDLVARPSAVTSSASADGMVVP